MTPKEKEKEKAKELVHKFLSFQAKQCALICVDEILDTLNKDIKDLDVRGNVLLDLIKYWQQVKTEIEKL